MLLSKVDLRSFAIALVALSPTIIVGLQAKADAPAAAPVVAAAPAGVAAPAAPVPAPAAQAQLPEGALTPGASRPVADTDISKYISGFQVRKVTNDAGTHLEVIGLGEPNCLRHIHLDLDPPSGTEPGIYGIRVTRTDFRAANGVAVNAEQDCSAERTARCSRDPDSACRDIHDAGVAGPLGLNSFQSTLLTEDGRIQFRQENLNLPAGDPNAVQFRELSRAMGGPLDYRTPATIAAELERQQQQSRNEQLVSTCREADRGSREALENLREMLGAEGVERNSRFLTRLEHKVDQTELEAIQHRVEQAETVEALNTLIDEVAEFARGHADMKSAAIQLLVDGIAKKALELESESGGTNFDRARLRLAERALRVASSLDRRNMSLRRAYYTARLEVYRFQANTGDDRFYNATVAREAGRAREEVLRWAAQHPRDADAAAVARAYNTAVAPQYPIPLTVNTPYGPQIFGYTAGSSLDRSFVQRSMEEEIRAYRENSMLNAYGFGGSPSSSGGNANSMGTRNSRF